MNKIPTYSFFNTGRKEKLVDVFIWTVPSPYLTDIPHCHDYHEIMFFNKGGGNHDIDFKSYPLESNAVHIVPKLYLHQLQRTKNSEGFTIAVSDIFIDQLIKFDPTTNYRSLFTDVSVKKLNATEMDGIEYYLKEIQKIDNNDSIRQNLCACVLLKLVEILNLKIVPSSFIETNIRKLIEENFMKRLSSQQYADKLNISVVNLNVKLKKSTGKTIGKLQDEMLISKIKQRIYSSNDEMKEIAGQFGFLDYAHFSKFFKNHSGNSPSEYKKSLQKHTSDR